MPSHYCLNVVTGITSRRTMGATAAKASCFFRESMCPTHRKGIGLHRFHIAACRYIFRSIIVLHVRPGIFMPPPPILWSMGRGGSMFSTCPSACACVRATALPSISVVVSNKHRPEQWAKWPSGVRRHTRKISPYLILSSDF